MNVQPPKSLYFSETAIDGDVWIAMHSNITFHNGDHLVFHDGSPVVFHGPLMPDWHKAAPLPRITYIGEADL